MTNLQQQLDALWGATLVEINHDIKTHRLVFLIDILRAGERASYRLEFIEVRQFSIKHTGLLEDWAYVELTSIAVKPMDDRLLIECELWSSDSILRVDCRDCVLHS